MDDEFDEVIAEFLVESYDNLDRLDQDLLALEENPGEVALLASAFRTIHTIKGTCGFLGFGKLERVTHVGENLLSKLRDGALALDSEITTALLAMVDAVRAMLAAIESTGADGTELYEPLAATLTALSEGRSASTEAADESSADSSATTPAEESVPAAQTVSAIAGANDSGASDAAVSEAGSVGGDAPGTPVGDLLVASGATEPDAVSLALAEQDLGDERPLGEILVDHGAVDPADVERAVLAQLDDDQSPGTAEHVPAESSGGPGATPAGSGTALTPSEGRLSLSDSTIRVDVGVLDRLMNLVGELVLSRNNILQHVNASSDQSIIASSQQLDLVTGELQECVMKTRMQPIGTVWTKFTRVVRDLSIQCGKQVRIEMEGEDTELDKTILEAIKDPLTHVVRNTVDHGIEKPEDRRAAGKPAEGLLKMRARHEGGQVVIEIVDDGAGIDGARVKAKAVSKGIISERTAQNMSPRDAIALIFAPGFSTAEAVTNVSGRGVGMDVVKTNIERIGGTVDVESEVGEGTTLRIKIPLTLAIVPALLIECAGERYAIPQIEVLELVRLDGANATNAVEMLHNAPVYRLRGNLLPLVYLRNELGLDPPPEEASLTIAVVASEDRPWGLVVDGVTTTEEIVVKPLGRILRSIPAFSGATIMGDGQVSLILDIAGLAMASNVVATAEAVRRELGSSVEHDTRATMKLLVVSRGEDQLAVDLSQIDRLEQFAMSSVERAGHLDVVQYRDRILPLANLGGSFEDSHLTVIVFERDGHLVGLVVEAIVDIVEVPVGAGSEGPAGTIVVRDRVTELVDVDATLAVATDWLHRNVLEVFA